MPILLLCYGEPEAKDMLRRAIIARYGMSPPALDSLEIDFEGRFRTKVGPVKAWVPLEVKTRFDFPSYMRLDFVAKPMGMAVRRGIEAFDSDLYRTTRNNGDVVEITNYEQIESVRRRMWTMAAIMLTPLSETFIKLSVIDENTIRVENTVMDDQLEMHFAPDGAVESVQVMCLNVDTNKQQCYRLTLSEESETVNELIIPSQIQAYWDDKISFEMHAKKIDVNPALAQDIFTLEEDI